MTSNRQWTFNNINHDIYQRNAVFPTAGQYDIDFSVTIDGNELIQSVCLGFSVVFNVIDPVTFRPWLNVDSAGNNLYRYGSVGSNCAPDRYYNFEFSYLDPVSRQNAAKFLDSIPNGYWVTVKNIPSATYSANVYPAQWEADTATYGKGNTLYDKLKALNLTIDSFNAPRVFLFIYKKNDNSFAPQQKMVDGCNGCDHPGIFVSGADLYGYGDFTGNWAIEEMGYVALAGDGPHESHHRYGRVTSDRGRYTGQFYPVVQSEPDAAGPGCQRYQCQAISLFAAEAVDL